MQYVSIDIETTGLDPDRHQILQVAAVADVDPTVQIEHLPYIDLTLRWENIHGEPAALAMNADLLRRVPGGVDPQGAMIDLCGFLDRFRHGGDDKLTAAGKNFASFDLQFLRRLHPPITRRLRHRYLDPAMLYMTHYDDKLPNTETCLERMKGASSLVLRHDALDDARQVVRLLRAKLGGRLT